MRLGLLIAIALSGFSLARAHYRANRRLQTAYLPSPFDRIQRDFLALRRRVTARHILLPPKSTELALTLKQKIRNKVSEEDSFVIDVFETAAKRYSLDKDTAERGGLLGELAPQGYCLAPELDEACFMVPLGQVAGPIESTFGSHLLLVSERTNCPKLDGTFSRILRGSDGKAVLAEPEGDNDSEKMVFFLKQVTLWVSVIVAGGVLAELTASI